MIAAILLQASVLLAEPLYLSDEPPELRAARYIAFRHAGLAEPDPSMSPEAAMGAAQQIAAAIRDDGASFHDLAARLMRGRSVELGSFARGMLPKALDEWLFSAEIGDVSAPLDSPYGVVLLCRVRAWAGARTIVLRGADAKSRATVVERRLQSGVPFADVARDSSDDAESAARGGATMIFQRGPSDDVVKAACFAMEPGVWRGPIETPDGIWFVARLEAEALESVVPRERTCVRLRALLVPWAAEEGVAPERARAEALARATALAERVAAGESLAELAREHDGDPGGRARSGDLGWVFRGDPRRPSWTDPLMARPAGWVSATPIETPHGYVVAARER